MVWTHRPSWWATAAAGWLVDAVQRDDPATDFSGTALTGITPHLRWSADRLSTEVPPDAARRHFLHDAGDAAAARAIGQLRPQAESGRAVAPHLSAVSYGRVPRLYVEALQDRSLALPLQRRMQQLSPGARRLSIDCGHVPQCVRPRESAERTCAALETMATADRRSASGVAGAAL